MNTGQCNDVSHGHAHAVNGPGHSTGAAHHHCHGVDPQADSRWLSCAIALLIMLLTGEVTVGLLINSTALIGDAGHILTDVCALFIALYTNWLIAKKPHDLQWREKREKISASINAWTLIIIGGFFVYQGINHIVNPYIPDGTFMVATSIVGVIINLLVVLLLGKANRESVNIEGAYQHIFTDLLGFVITLLAGLTIVVGQVPYADGCACLIIASIMVYSGMRLLHTIRMSI